MKGRAHRRIRHRWPGCAFNLNFLAGCLAGFAPGCERIIKLPSVLQRVNYNGPYHRISIRSKAAVDWAAWTGDVWETLTCAAADDPVCLEAPARSLRRGSSMTLGRLSQIEWGAPIRMMRLQL